MSTGRQTKKRPRTNTTEIISNKNSIRLFNDAAFLLSYINSNDIFLWTLLSGQITTTSFSDLYENSQKIEWKQVLIEIRNNLKLDEKSKLKRFMINRLIDECSRNADVFNDKVKKLYEEIERQVSDSISPEQDCYNRLQSIYDVYTEVKKWKQLQCERRLFYKECHRRCSLPTLQRLITDEFIDLAESLRQDPKFLKSDPRKALKELFIHSLIVVVQPSGTDCIAVTKYEKSGNEFVTKLKTRIICLLDPDRIQEYLELSQVDVTLYLKDRACDPTGDMQSPLQWKTRTVLCDEKEERKFLFIELNENDSIKLTKKNCTRKLLYNNRLCQLEFRTALKIIGTHFEECLTIKSQLFGLCSHTKYSSKYLTKVFVEELKQIYTAINHNTHINVLKGYICEFYKRITGVEAKFFTQQFIHDELEKVYMSFRNSAASDDIPGRIPDLNIYEDILEKLISPMKFLASHPFLSMMYRDGLFLGICNDTVDQQLNNNTLTKPHILIRFAISKEQKTLENPNIIFVIFNGTLSKARVTHGYLVADITSICEAAEKEGNQLQVFNYNKTLPFCNFRQYYDIDLSRDNLIQTNDKIQYFPLKTLLRNTIRNNQVQYLTLNEQQSVAYTFDMSGQLTGNRDLTADAVAFLQGQFALWCEMQNIRGTLSRYSIDEEIDYDDFHEFFNENTL